MPLYGHELRENWTPLESGLAWTLTLDDPEEFVGRKALLAIQGVGCPHRLVGLEVTGRGIPREGYPVLREGQPVGEVTSGALSPTTGKAVALAHVRQEAAKLGTALHVEVRGKPIEAVVVRRPFYKNPALRA
jgi:aminomethyltransferase